MRILLTEDDEVLGDALSISLQSAGYVLDWAADGQQAINSVQSIDYDAIVLDLGLPKLNGLDVLRAIRTKKNKVPIIIISARESVEDRIKGLDLGADDYLAKPFKFVELEARLRAVIRRANHVSENALEFGPLLFDTKSRIFKIDGQQLDLSKREMALLEVLLVKTGESVTKEVILEKLYSWDNEITDNAIEVCIHRVRNKLKPHHINITNRRGLGYHLSIVE